jgi:uncharacterized SAM-binding protein YcdF (DUF218 family)
MMFPDRSPLSLKRTNQWRSLLAAGVAIVGFPIWAATAVALDDNGHREDPGGKWDAIVVAGCRVNLDGRASLSLVRRTAKAVALWQAGRAPVIVLTGGSGKWPRTEAEAAAEVARSLGVPARNLVLESRSKDTAENARFASQVTSAQRIIVVTDTYHVRRCEWFFRRHFQTVVGVGVVSPNAQRAIGAFREAIAVAYYLLGGLRSTE